MEKEYKDLAVLLDGIPNGFPATESGVELRLLAKLFSPEEAALACHLETEARGLPEIAAKAGLPEAATKVLLKGMLGKGLIEVRRMEGGLGYKLIPFIVGFYEGQRGQIDAEFAALVEAYVKEGFHRVMSVKPSVHRVIPVEETIPVGIEVMPYERASTYVRAAKAWGVLPCICRVQKRLIGQACVHSEETCLVLSDRPGVFENARGFRALSLDGALKVLSDAAAEGLVHSTGNSVKGVSYICNCCTCSCGVLRGFAEYGYADSIGRSDFLAKADPESCTGCGLCVDRCQFKAISLVDWVSRVDESRCFGCGLCVATCPTGSLSLGQKAAAELESPPETEEDWARARAAARRKTNA